MQIPPPLAPPLATPRETLRQRAADLEAAFLSEMLSHAGFGAAQADFGGGIGEEQFASFLRDEHARMLVERGGIGLAEQLFRAMGGKDA